MRFFRVMVAIGRCERGSSMGGTLSSKRSGPNLSMEPQATVRKRPVANKLFRILSEWLKTLACGTSNPIARKAPTTERPSGLISIA